jgi:hypothetical protein
MKQTTNNKRDKAMRLMMQDYTAISKHSNQFIMMTKKQEAEWENAQIAQYMQMPEVFLDFELERRSGLTEAQKELEEFSLVMFRSRKDAQELVAEYKLWLRAKVSVQK